MNDTPHHPSHQLASHSKLEALGLKALHGGTSNDVIVDVSKLSEQQANRLLTHLSDHFPQREVRWTDRHITVYDKPVSIEFQKSLSASQPALTIEEVTHELQKAVGQHRKIFSAPAPFPLAKKVIHPEAPPSEPQTVPVHVVPPKERHILRVEPDAAATPPQDIPVHIGASKASDMPIDMKPDFDAHKPSKGSSPPQRPSERHRRSLSGKRNPPHEGPSHPRHVRFRRSSPGHGGGNPPSEPSGDPNRPEPHTHEARRISVGDFKSTPGGGAPGHIGQAEGGAVTVLERPQLQEAEAAIENAAKWGLSTKLMLGGGIAAAMLLALKILKGDKKEPVKRSASPLAPVQTKAQPAPQANLPAKNWQEAIAQKDVPPEPGMHR